MKGLLLQKGKINKRGEMFLSRLLFGIFFITPPRMNYIVR